MALIEEFEIQRECERLVYRFLKTLESEQGSTADFFTEDGQAFDLVGRERIREHFKSIESVDNNVNVNLSTNLVIDIENAYHARATNYVTHFVAQPAPSDLTVPQGGQVGGELDTPRSITRWDWEFIRIGDEWLISKLQYPEPVLLRSDVIDELKASGID